MANSEQCLDHDWFPRPLPQNVQIGNNSWLYSTFAFAHYRSQESRGVIVGHDTGIYSGTFFDLGPQGLIRIGNYCSIVGAIFTANCSITIGDYALISHEVVIADRAFASPEHCDTAAANPAEHAGIAIDDNVWIGARAIIAGTVHIGEGAIIGAGATITSNVPPYCIAAGNPAKIVGTVKRN